MAYSHVPTYVNKGAFQSGTAALTVPVPTGYRNDDMLVLFVESANEAIAVPAGWTQFTNSPQSTGTAAAAGGVRLGVFWKLATGLEASVTVADTGDHTTAIMMAFRGVDPLNPVNITAGSVSAATTAMVFPTATTTVANCLVILAAAMDTDAASTATMGAVTNAALSSITERHDETVIAGAGGGLAIATGIKATAGAIGTSSATGSTSVTHAYMTIAINGRSDADIVPRGQYKIDMTTPVAVGDYVSPITDGLYLVADISPVWQTDNPITPKIEALTTANSFANTATVTNTAFTPESSATTYSSRGGNLVYDTKNDRYLLFGGYDGTTRYNLVWAKDMTTPGRPWRKLAPTGTPPTAKNLAAATYFRGNKTTGGADTAVMIVWGGNVGASDTNEMHILDVTTPGSEAWTVVTQTSAPTARSYITKHMVAVPVGGDTSQCTVYLFGGWAAARENQLVKCTIDLDTLTATTWSTLKATGTAGNPTIRSGTIMDYKASTNKLYIYGGYSGTAYLSDFWSYDITGNSFTQETVTGTAPQLAELGAGGFDATNNRFWFTGGWNSAASTGGHNHIGYVSSVGSSASYVSVRADDNDNQGYAQHSSSASTIDTKRGWLVLYTMMTYDSTERYSFVIDMNDGITSGKPVYGLNDAEFMQARDAPSSVYDSTAGEWLAMSGFSGMGDEVTIATGTHNNDIWAYDQTNNRWRYANKGHLGMPHTEGLTAVYDTTRSRIIAFGGLSGISETSNEVWSATRDANGLYQWAKLAPTGTPPISRWLCTAVFDSANNRALFVMGGDKATQFTDVWELSFSSSADGVWTQRSATGTPPTAVVGAGYAAKTSNTRLYIHGGATVPALTSVSSQLVYLDYSTTNTAWTAPTSSAGTARRTPGLGYDSVNDRLVTFGGFNGTVSIQALQYWNVATPGAWSTAAAPAVLPDARRSLGYTFQNGKFLITHGRSDSSPWYSNTWEITPNYGTPNSSTCTPKFPRRSQPHYFLYDPNTQGGYHWQVWETEESTDQTKQSFGSNAETVADFYLGSAPTVALNTPANAGSSNLNPALTFTGTDADSDDITYQIQIDTANTFDSQSVTPAFVQATTGDFVTSPFTSTAFGSNVTVGNYIIVGFGLDNNTLGDVLTVTDNKGNTYTQWPSYNYSIGTTDWLEMDLWYTKVTTGGAGLTVTGTYDSVSSNMSLIAQEFSGVSATSPADKTAHATGTSTAPSSGNTATLAQAAELIIGHSVHALTVSAYSLGSGFTNLTQVSVANRQHAMESKVVNSTAATAATFGIAASREWIAAVATFKAAALGPLIDRLSNTNVGFSGTPDNVDPYASAQAVSYTVQSGTTTSTLAKSPGTAANVDLSAGVDWVTPNNALLEDGSYATDAGGSSSAGDYLQVTNFGLSVPSTATILGVLVEIKELSSGTNTKATDLRLLKAGALTGTNQGGSSALPTSLQYVSYGGSSNMWGATLTPADVNASNFGVSLEVGPIAFASWQASVDHIRVTVYYSTTSETLTNATTYYWRVRGKDPSGTNSYGAWSSTRSFTAASGATYTTTHTTDALKRKQFTPTHTTDANKKLTTTKTHTTDANKKKAGVLLTHTTDSLKRKQFTLTHTTDANKKKTTTKTHTTDANKRITGITRTHTTDAFLRKQFTKTHTTDANRKVSGNLHTHTTDANKKKAGLTVTHTTDANKKKAGITVTHTTDSLKRKQFTLTHTTDSLKRQQFTKTHTTDSNKKKTTTKTHTTDANKKKSGITVTHTTDANKKTSGLTRTHTTDALKRQQFTKTHTTDTLKRKQFTLTHTTDANKRLATTKTHTTDANKKKTTLATHTTDANKKKSGLTRTHTTDSLLRKQFTKTHTTDSLKRTANTRTHTTDSLKRKANLLTHTTDANKKKTTLVTHTTDANKKKTGLTVSHTTDALKRQQFTKTHTTDAYTHIGVTTYTKTHTTDALKRKQFTLTHTTDSNKRKALSVTHTTDANKKTSGLTRTHTTDANKKKSLTVSHTTSANTKKTTLVTHTTDANKKKSGLTVTHTTDALKRQQFTKTHTTDAFKRKQFTLSHTTDALKRKQFLLTHTTDSNKKKTTLKTHTTDSNKRRVTLVTHTTDALKRKQFILTHTTDSLLRKQFTKTHTTDSNKRLATVKSHTTDANKRKVTLVTHTTDANKRVTGLTRTHTTDALKRKQFTLTHTTDSLKRKANTVSHTTDSNKKKTTTISHTTDAYVGYDDYSREDKVTLPSNDNTLATRYTGSERGDVATNDDTTYVGITGFDYMVHEFKHKHANNTSTITPICNLKSTLAGSASTIYLQVYNQNSGLWETVDSNNTVAANTDVTLTGSISVSVSNYYTTDKWVSCRVYQRTA